MGRASAELYTSYTSQTTWRTLYTAISQLWTDAGFTKTTDTGQVNWSTVSYTGSSNATFGYEIRKIANAVLGDLYCRMEFRWGNFGQGSTVIWMSVGTGTDGAGNLTGVLMQPYPSLCTDAATLPTDYNDLTLRTSMASCDDGSFMFVHALGLSATYFMSAQHTLLFCRTSDSDGTYNDNGAILANPYNTSNSWTGLTTHAISRELPPGAYNHQAPTGAMPRSPWLQCYPYYVSQPSIEVSGTGFVTVAELMTPTPNWIMPLVGVNGVDVGAGAEITATVLGASRTYKVIGSQLRSMDRGNYGTDSDSRLVPAILWEA